MKSRIPRHAILPQINAQRGCRPKQYNEGKRIESPITSISINNVIWHRRRAAGVSFRKNKQKISAFWNRNVDSSFIFLYWLIKNAKTEFCCDERAKRIIYPPLTSLKAYCSHANLEQNLSVNPSKNGQCFSSYTNTYKEIHNYCRVDPSDCHTTETWNTKGTQSFLRSMHRSAINPHRTNGGKE